MEPSLACLIDASVPLRLCEIAREACNARRLHTDAVFVLAPAIVGRTLDMAAV